MWPMAVVIDIIFHFYWEFFIIRFRIIIVDNKCNEQKKTTQNDMGRCLIVRYMSKAFKRINNVFIVVFSFNNRMFNHSTNRCKCCHQSEILFDIQTKMKQNKKN